MKRERGGLGRSVVQRSAPGVLMNKEREGRSGQTGQRLDVINSCSLGEDFSM